MQSIFSNRRNSISSSGNGGRRPRAKRNWRRFFARFGTVAAIVFFAGTIAMIGVIAWVARELPDPNNIDNRQVPETTRIYDRSGEHVLYEIHGAQKRTIVELDQIADDVKHATLAAEDRNFYKHGGLDVRGMVRGLFRSLTYLVTHKGNLQTGSTITQQFIKKAVLTDEKTLIRKAREIILSIEMERRFSKDQILKLYLNEIPYGSVAYGIESASQTFFAKKAKDLTLSESALLASLPNAPTYFSPYGNHLDALIARQHYVLDGMVTEGYVTREQADAAKEDKVLERVQPKREPITAPHFVFYVKELLAEEYGEQVVERGGLKVITTLDFDKQAIAEKAIADNLETIHTWKANSAALVAIDPKSGDILSMVGSADYFNKEINGEYNAVLGKLQPGSSIKPIVYAAAFEKGFTPTTVIEDVKTEFSTSGTSYSPSNYDLKERGPVLLKEALAGSLNIPAVKMLYLTGLAQFQDFATRVGYTTFEDRSRFGLSLVLGGAEVRMLEHVSAFGTFAEEGLWRPSKAILKVEDKDGKVLKDATEPTTGKRAYSPEIARQINDILSDNEARAYVFGAKNYLTLADRPVAAKTGTTNDYKDAWAMGYTPSLVAGVWVGDSTGNATMKRGADGSKVAAPIWNQFMRESLKGTEPEFFTAPQHVVTDKPVLDGDKNSQTPVKVDKITGKLATEFTPPEQIEERRYGLPHSILYFVDKNDPRGPVPAHPEEDPQFTNWETAYAKWIETKSAEGGTGVIIDTSSPPTEYDDVHIPENVPQVSILSPYEGATITERSFQASANASARRGITKIEYYMDGELIGVATSQPFMTAVNVPNRISKGFRTFSAKAFDDVGNNATASITVNFTAEPGPLGIQWTAPGNQQTLYSTSFPYSIRFSIDDPKAVATLTITAKDDGNGTEQVIGAIDHPALPSISLTWQTAPRLGTYHLTVDATLSSGEHRAEYTTVYIR